MKKLGLFIATAVMLVLFAFSASAAKEGYYTYEVENGEATITDVDESIKGDIIIPSTLNGYNVTSIGDSAFEFCTQLTSITIPDSVRTINSSAFESCINLTSITLHDNITSIGSLAFDNTAYYNNDSNWENKALYIGNYLISVATDISNSYVIKNGTKCIAGSAFKDCTSLTNVTIPNSVASIGYSAFYNCTNLKKITFPNSLTSIGNYAFKGCTSLTGITIPNSVTSIGVDAFYNTAYYNNSSNWSDAVLYISNCLIKVHNGYSHISIKDGTRYIATSAFKGCSVLKSVKIPNSVTRIGGSAFSGCTGISTITIPNSVTYIGSSAFNNCSSLTSVVLSSNITSISDDTFYLCKSLTNITIPNKVTNIGDRAFYLCQNLTSLTIPDNVTNIGVSAFNYCISLATVTLGSSVANIGSGAFTNCTRLTSITIPDSTSIIGNYAFNSCSNLSSVTIGNGVTSIGDYAFCDCTRLTSIKIPDSVTSIGSSAFRGCKTLINVILGDSITSIGSSTFNGCTSLTSITIPDNVTSIGNYAFSNCTNLTSITIPASVTCIGEGAFCNCSNLTSITLPFVGEKQNGTSNTHFGYIFGAYNSSSNDEYVPASLKEVVISTPCKSIGSYAFYYCSSLTSITIPDSVTSIGSSVFRGCSSLTSITIPDSVTSIGSYAFSGCSSLTSITIPDSVTSIGEDTFYYCTSLTSITIPDSVTSIGFRAFYECSKITDVYYTGTKSQWQTITIKQYNYALTNAKIHYTHKIVSIAQQDPTCTKVGYTSGEQCSDCKEWISGHELLPKIEHTFSPSYTIDAEATCTTNGSKSRHCTGINCSATTDRIIIDAKGHSIATTTTPASLTSKGKIETGCTNCDYVELGLIIGKISTVTLSKTNYIYDGKNKTPKVTITDSDGYTLVKNVDYKTSVASKRSGIGRYTVKVTFMGNYSGSKSVYFYIKPGKPATVKSASQTTSSVKLSWSAVEGAAGYTVYRYSPSKKTYVKAGTTEGTSLTVKSLNAGTKYTFKVVAYGKTSAGKVYESDSYALLKTATKTATPTLSKVTTTKGKAVLTHTNVSGETGYTVYYSTSKDSGFKKYANFKADTTTCNITGLTSGKTYYFKVRTYITTDSGYVYSAWSTVKSVKVK